MHAGPPPAPSGIEYSLKETNETLTSFVLTWNSSFNSKYALTSYTLIAPIEENPMLACPYSCNPHVPCQCSGLARGNGITIAISAVNCENQEGIPKKIIIASGTIKIVDIMGVDSLSSLLAPILA